MYYPLLVNDSRYLIGRFSRIRIQNSLENLYNATEYNQQRRNSSTTRYVTMTDVYCCARHSSVSPWTGERVKPQWMDVQFS